MSKSFKSIFSKIFEELKKKITEEEYVSKIIDRERSINFDPFDYNKGWLLNTKELVREFCLPQKYVSIFSNSNEYFIVLPEIQETDMQFMNGIVTNICEVESEDGEVLRQYYRDIPGLVTAICYQNESYFKSEIEQEILFNEIFGIDIERIEFENIKKFIKPIDIWRIDSDAIYLDNDTSTDDLSLICYQVYGAFLIENHNLLSLPFQDEQLLINIKALFENYVKISEALFRGVTSTQWYHMFLEFFRCIERLFRIPYLIDFQKAADIKTNIDTIEVLLDKYLKWRPSDREALNKLIATIKDDLDIDSLILKFPNILVNDENKISKLCEEIYERRIKIAHWDRKFDRNKYNFNSDIIFVLSILIDKLYSKFPSI